MVNDRTASSTSYQINEVGPSPGEKLFEELMSSEEARRSKELENHYVIMPAMTDIYSADARVNGPEGTVRVPYNSSTQIAMAKEELREYLRKHSII